MRSRLGAWLLAGCAAWLAGMSGGSTASAHPAYLTAAQVSVEPDGRFRLVMQFDTLAFALNDTSARIGNAPMEALLDGPRTELETRLADARDRFQRGLILRTDRGQGNAESVDFPDAAAVLAWRNTHDPVLPVALPVTMTGSLPAGAGSVAIRFPAIFDQVILTVERPGEEPSAEPVEAGAFSTSLPIRLDPAKPPPAPAPRWAALQGYVEMGFRHILPGGLDHVLFVLGLFLLSPRLRPLFVQTTVFTVAHSITLGLSLFGGVHLPGFVVGPLIALSIAVVAVENLFVRELHTGRTVVVFGFGLVHGLDFATALTALGLPRRDFLTALVGFNFGVELGQLTVILAAFATVGLLRQWPRYRVAVVYPLSACIAVVALYWTVQRLFATR